MSSPPPVFTPGLHHSPPPSSESKKAQEHPFAEEEFSLPKTSEQHKKTASEKAENVNMAQEELKSKEARGFQIPRILKKIWDFMNKASDIIVMAIGVPLKYVGLCFLVIGAVHFVVILCISIPQITLATGVMAVIFALIKSGALPTIIAGATLYKFGCDLIENKSLPSLNLIPWVLPLPFYQWLNMGKTPSPMDSK
ncbi:putative uncharacterized protein [Parachlamydia acanthamoebae UV-7]|uniref:Uncharacterized protein n=2 Tax=Parachlamydia acanthamoebae TaxID=83552 RepID=F8KX59_PARAV|nr:hypothetical protein [Parachlamydia acanthamoebae]KIA78734.1 hypothetical protein DB43_DL00040 [Parachlamydia acanthamoebae]CCB85526.1 putative uncharacterized protein [Parachlamydia acanthamoebae UV-7]